MGKQHHLVTLHGSILQKNLGCLCARTKTMRHAPFLLGTAFPIYWCISITFLIVLVIFVRMFFRCHPFATYGACSCAPNRGPPARPLLLHIELAWICIMG